MLPEFIATNRAEIIRRCRALSHEVDSAAARARLAEPAVVTPARDERPLTEEGNSFGSRLRDARERAHITLESIASDTKIKQPLLAALERNDVSQWPRGIYRRAYLRDYATAIGLPSEQVLAEFLRLFPEDEQLSTPLVEQPAGELRLTLAADYRSGVRFALMRGLATIRDSRLVFLAGKIAAWLSQPLWTMTATYAVSLEFDTKAPLTGRGTVRATNAHACLVRAFRKAIKEFPAERWRSLVVVLERVEDAPDSAVAVRSMNTTPWTEGTPVNELPLASRARSPHRWTHQAPQLLSVRPQPPAPPSGADQSVGR
jgi:transcriptional regulator with XRE-family HTH domain